MKQSHDHISPYYEVSNIRDPRQLKVFTVQLQRYFREQAQELDRWIKSKEVSVANLTTLEEMLYSRFGITSQALRLFGEYEREQDWEQSKSAVIGYALVHMQSEALAGRLDVNSFPLKRLGQVDTNAGHFLNVSMDPAARSLRPFDLAGWERILNGPYECARVTNGKSAGRSEASASVITLTASQRELLVPLQAHWLIKQRGECVAGYDPRPIPLIVGPSGSGKTALVRHFAAKEKIPMKDFNIGTWIITGAKADPPTLDEIGDFIRNNERGVLFLDEVDKLYATTDWSRCIQQEIYALLDGRTDSFSSWDDTMARKLARDFFLVGAGTWQMRYAGRHHALGFGAKKADDAWAIELDRQDEIPEELLMRFNAEVLHLRPLTKIEFSERIIAIHDVLALVRPTEERLEQLSEKAVVSCRHNRWLEAYASHMLRSDEVW
jgi:hypothetical protein